MRSRVYTVCILCVYIVYIIACLYYTDTLLLILALLTNTLSLNYLIAPLVVCDYLASQCVIV